jgi:hypothetical protein
MFFGLSANDPRIILPYFIAFLHDILILGVVVIIGKITSSIVSNKYKSIVEKIFSILLIIIGIFLAFYPKILREYLVFPVNILDSDMSSAETLITNYLGLNAIKPSLIALGLGVIIYIKKNKINKL